MSDPAFESSSFSIRAPKLGIDEARMAAVAPTAAQSPTSMASSILLESGLVSRLSFSANDGVDDDEELRLPPLSRNPSSIGCMVTL
jgi:hypothetical protein